MTLTSDLSRTSQSVFTESVIEISPGLSVQVGLRSDNMNQSAVGRQLSELGRQTTPHLGMVWQLAGRASILKANYSQGFKPPVSLLWAIRWWEIRHCAQKKVATQS